MFLSATALLIVTMWQLLPTAVHGLHHILNTSTHPRSP